MKTGNRPGSRAGSRTGSRAGGRACMRVVGMWIEQSVRGKNGRQSKQNTELAGKFNAPGVRTIVCPESFKVQTRVQTRVRIGKLSERIGKLSEPIDSRHLFYGIYSGPTYFRRTSAAVSAWILRAISHQTFFHPHRNIVLLTGLSK